MLRFIFIILILLVAGLGFAWYSSQSLPEWYQQEADQQERVTENLSEQISQQGVGNFLGNKFAGVMNGEMELSEAEFNALLMTSLKSSEDGRRLLSVSDAVNAEIHDQELELGMVVDLQKVAALDAKSRRAVEKVTSALPFLSQSKVFLAVTGEPVARHGNIGFTDDFSVTIGAFPISSSLLAQLGVPVHKASTASLPLKYMSIRAIDLEKDKITLKVLPRF